VKQDVQEALARLRETLEQARAMPMSASAVVNRAEVLAQVDEVATALERAFSVASDLVGDREAVVAAGHSEAEEILRKARDEAERLAAETHVFQVAQQRAAEVEEASRREADSLRAEADRYVEDKLAHFEASLMRTLEAVQRGRARISEDLPDPLADPATHDAPA
jgi:hypothetical protein